MELWEFVALALLGFISGWINVVAGGGSLINILAMLFMGISGTTANGTNRIAVFFQNLAALGTFWRSGFIVFKTCFILSFYTSLGAVVGAFFGTKLDAVWFDRFLAFILIIVFFVIWGKQKGMKGKKIQSSLARAPRFQGYFLLMLAGFWGGIIQVGVGFILIPILHYTFRLNLVVTNAYKTFIVLIYTVLALIIFAGSNKINWHIGIAIASGALVGGWWGAKAAIKLNAKWIYHFIYLSLIVTISKLLFF